MIYRIVAEVGETLAPITKHKSKSPRLYERLSSARCAATLMRTFSPFPLLIQGMETQGDWQEVH